MIFNDQIYLFLFREIIVAHLLEFSQSDVSILLESLNASWETRATQLLFLITRKGFSKWHPEIENTKIILRLVGWSGLAAVSHTHKQLCTFCEYLPDLSCNKELEASCNSLNTGTNLSVSVWRWSNIFLKRNWTSWLKHLLTYAGTTRQVSTVKNRLCPKWKWIASKSERIWCLINSWEAQKLNWPTKCRLHIQNRSACCTWLEQGGKCRRQVLVR